MDNTGFLPSTCIQRVQQEGQAGRTHSIAL